jgi:hypothetical protein
MKTILVDMPGRFTTEFHGVPEVFLPSWYSCLVTPKSIQKKNHEGEKGAEGKR